MSFQHTVVYVMRHIDIGGHIDIPYKKIGITGKGNATLDSRLHQISNTKSPIKAQCIAAWEHENAMRVEQALHALLDDNRVEGEWFYDKDDSLVERMRPMMELIGATTMRIESTQDDYTKDILKRENENKNLVYKAVLGEISELLTEPMRTSVRDNKGPTFFSDKTELTYYINHRKSGAHNLEVGRSKKVQESLQAFLELNNFEPEIGPTGLVNLNGLSNRRVADAINLIEGNFKQSN